MCPCQHATPHTHRTLFQVWLGRWQETDVAIKQLGSLSALGVQTGSLQHDSSGGERPPAADARRRAARPRTSEARWSGVPFLLRRGYAPPSAVSCGHRVLPLRSALSALPLRPAARCLPPAGIKMDAEVQRALHKEVDLMRKMRHPNIILFMGVVAEPAAVVTGEGLGVPGAWQGVGRRLRSCAGGGAGGGGYR